MVAPAAGEIVLVPFPFSDQLMAHLGFLGEAHIGKGLGDIVDDELVAILYRHRAELQARLAGGANPALPPTGDETSVSGSSTLPESASGN